MAEKKWHAEFGLLAVGAWSIVVGVPVLLFHMEVPGLVIVDHVHALFLFVASQFLIFWMIARPRTVKQKPESREPVPSLKQPPAAAPDKSVWEAQVVEGGAELPKVLRSVAATNGFLAKFSITNYIGSSRPRRVSVQPRGIDRVLLPGQELTVIAVGVQQTPTIRIVESDLVTEILVEGATLDVLVDVGSTAGRA